MSSRRIHVSFAVPDDMIYDEFEDVLELPDDVEIDNWRVLDADDEYDGYLRYLQDFVYSTDVLANKSPLSYEEWKAENLDFCIYHTPAELFRELDHLSRSWHNAWVSLIRVKVTGRKNKRVQCVYSMHENYPFRDSEHVLYCHLTADKRVYLNHKTNSIVTLLRHSGNWYTKTRFNNKDDAIKELFDCAFPVGCFIAYNDQDAMKALNDVKPGNYVVAIFRN